MQKRTNKYTVAPEMIYLYKSIHFLTWGISLEESLEQKHGIWALPVATTIPQRQREWPGRGGKNHQESGIRQGKLGFPPWLSWLRHVWPVTRFLGPGVQPTTAGANDVFASSPLVFSPLVPCNSQKFLNFLHSLGKKYLQSTEFQNFLGNTKERSIQWKVFYILETKSVTTYAKTTNSLILDVWSLAQ